MAGASDSEAERLLEHCPEDKRASLVSLARRVCNGPRARTAAIRLACVQCTNWDSREVAKCEITKCALHKFRMGK